MIEPFTGLPIIDATWARRILEEAMMSREIVVMEEPEETPLPPVDRSMVADSRKILEQQEGESLSDLIRRVKASSDVALVRVLIKPFQGKTWFIGDNA